jgi:hypothetical protein
VNNTPAPKKYDWSKAWIDRFYVLNSLLADSVFAMVAFAVVVGAFGLVVEFVVGPTIEMWRGWWHDAR